MTVVALAIAGYRVQWLARLVLAGAPIPPERRPHVAGAIKAQLIDVFGQRKLFKVKVAGTAHAFTFWGFIVLFLTIIEAYGALFDARLRDPGHRQEPRARLHRGHLRGRACCSHRRLHVDPARALARSALDRKSRFYGSHTDQAWLVLGMIFLVIATLLLYRGAQITTGYFPYQDDGWWPFASKADARTSRRTAGVRDDRSSSRRSRSSWAS